MEKNNYKYYAFISYTEADYDMVKWLHHKLEFYHIPVKIRERRPDLPKKWKIFEYKSEMKGGYLWEEIKKTLDDSKYLIVVCSSNTVVSKSVEKEINYFKETGREAQIIPFVIEGEACSSDPKKECFPQTLQDTGLRGISINEQGRDAAAVKVIAQMFDLEFDDLWQRYNKEMKRKRNIAFLSVIAFAIVALLVALWMWHLNNQITLSNKQLIKENIRMTSSEVLNLLEKGQYVDAKQQMRSIVDLWRNECCQEVPEMEKALRALYRYEYKDGIIKLYSKPLSDKQEYLSADSNYLYIRDLCEGDERIVSYSIFNGDSAKQIFPQKGQKISLPIRDFNHGLVLCSNNGYTYQRNGGWYTPQDTIAIYDQKTGKMIMQKVGGYYIGKILEKDKILLTHFDTLSNNRYLELMQINDGQIICQWSCPFEYDFNVAASLNNDSLTVIGGNRVLVYNVKNGDILCNIDYTKERIKYGHSCFLGNTSSTKSGKQFAKASEFGLGLFSTEKNNCVILNKSSSFSSISCNPLGTMLAAVKHGKKWENEKDSLLVYIPEFDLPIPFFSIEDDGFGDIFFADNNTIVESSRNMINVFWCDADFDVSHLFSSTGDYYVEFNEDSLYSFEIFKDSTKEIVCKINNSDDRNIRVYGFSPQDTYFMYETENNPLVFHQIKKDKDIVIPCDFQLDSRNLFFSDDESMFLMIIPYGNYDYFSLYNIRKDAENAIDFFWDLKISWETFYQRPRYALSADGSRVALSDGSKIIFLETDTLSNKPSIVINEIENCSVRGLCFSKGDSILLAASYSDGTIRFWNTITGEQMYNTIQSETNDNIIYLDISNDSQYLVGTSEYDYQNNNCKYFVWHIPSGLLVDKETNAWSWWAESLFKNSEIDRMKPDYRASFSKNTNEIIVNDHSFYRSYIDYSSRYGFLSRKFSFPSFDELIDRYSEEYD